MREMAVQLDRVVPWGRSLDEYRAMFDLGSEHEHISILGCGDGPASFNAELTRLGGKIISFDPIYSVPGHEIEKSFEESVDDVMSQVTSNPDRWVWGYHKSPERLKQQRYRVLKAFLADYEAGRKEGRYRVEALPKLPFGDKSFDLALCSHLLFLYSELLSEEFHIQSVQEMCRVANEVRIFPLLTLAQTSSPHINPTCEALQQQGYHCEIREVAYELQKGGNQMLLIRKLD